MCVMNVMYVNQTQLAEQADCDNEMNGWEWMNGSSELAEQLDMRYVVVVVGD